MDKMYLINSKNVEDYSESERQIRDELKSIDVETIYVDPLDYVQIYERTLSIKDRESNHPDVKYHINFTNGTRVMSAAVVSAAHLMDSEIHYVLNKNEYPELNPSELVLTYNVFNFPEIDKLKGVRRDLLLEFRGRKRLSNQELIASMGMTNTSLRHYTKDLERWNLINYRMEGKCKIWFLTDKGESILSRLYVPINQDSEVGPKASYGPKKRLKKK